VDRRSIFPSLATAIGASGAPRRRAGKDLRAGRRRARREVLEAAVSGEDVLVASARPCVRRAEHLEPLEKIRQSVRSDAESDRKVSNQQWAEVGIEDGSPNSAAVTGLQLSLLPDAAPLSSRPIRHLVQ